jgi:hypothetical protein
MAQKDTYRMLVCQCCMLTHANGECCSIDHGVEDGHPAPLSAVPADDDITMGMLREFHSDDCNGEDCECERYGFSWQACEGCGDTSGGDRWYLTGWPGDRARTRV